MNDGRGPTEPATGSAAEPAADDHDEVPDDYGTPYVVGIESGLPDHMTKRAKEFISASDCVVASNLYQEFLRNDGALPPEGSDDGPEVIRSSMGKQVELTRETFEHVRDGEDMTHVSGGDPDVYGKSDLILTMTRDDEATDVSVGTVPGVTAVLSSAAMIGASLPNSFYTVSLPNKWRGWNEVEEKLRATVISGFVIVLYNCQCNHERAVGVVHGGRVDDVSADIFSDVGRSKAGRSLDDETFSVTTLGDARVHDGDVDGMGASTLASTHETGPQSNDYQTYLVMPRGGHGVGDF